jgi:hypothetical protein
MPDTTVSEAQCFKEALGESGSAGIYKLVGQIDNSEIISHILYMAIYSPSTEV